MTSMSYSFLSLHSDPEIMQIHRDHVISFIVADVLLSFINPPVRQKKHQSQVVAVYPRRRALQWTEFPGQPWCEDM